MAMSPVRQSIHWRSLLSIYKGRRSSEEGGCQCDFYDFNLRIDGRRNNLNLRS
jgi:hypothetical protein